MVDRIYQKAAGTQKLTEQQKTTNRRKSSIRCRIEHVFSFMTNTMKAMYIRTIGIERAEVKIGLVKLT
jgi:transposase, IS5 family